MCAIGYPFRVVTYCLVFSVVVLIGKDFPCVSDSYILSPDVVFPESYSLIVC